MMRLSEAGAALGVPHQGADAEFTSVGSDSRTVAPVVTTAGAPTTCRVSQLTAQLTELDAGASATAILLEAV